MAIPIRCSRFTKLGMDRDWLFKMIISATIDCQWQKLDFSLIMKLVVVVQRKWCIVYEY